jgi:hypothetical protein
VIVTNSVAEYCTVTLHYTAGSQRLGASTVVIGVRQHGDAAHSLVLDREMQAAKMVWSLSNYGWDKKCGCIVLGQLPTVAVGQRQSGKSLANKNKSL